MSKRDISKLRKHDHSGKLCNVQAQRVSRRASRTDKVQRYLFENEKSVYFHISTIPQDLSTSLKRSPPKGRLNIDQHF